MKKLLILICGSLLIVGCQKEAQTLADQDATFVENSPKAGNHNYRILRCTGCDSEGANCKKCWCEGSGGNCLPDVVVQPSARMAIGDVFRAIASGTQSTIQSAFVANKNILNNYLSSADVNAVINATATATAEPGLNGSRFIMIKNSQGTITSAYPLYE